MDTKRHSYLGIQGNPSGNNCLSRCYRLVPKEEFIARTLDPLGRPLLQSQDLARRLTLHPLQVYLGS